MESAATDRHLKTAASNNSWIAQSAMVQLHQAQ
jgi:hypothetical protein